VTELSDRPVYPDDIVACPADCHDEFAHRHLRDGSVQYAHRGFGVDDQGRIVMGPRIPVAR
jgi:hypothetical protein